MALLGGSAGAVRRLGLGRRGSGGLAALGVRVPFPAVGAGGDGRRGVLGNAAALTGVPVPGSGAIVAAGRERRGRRATVGAAGRAGRPPELVAVAVVAVSGSGRLAGPGAGVPDVSTGAGRLVVGRQVSGSAAALSRMPKPSLRALVARWRAGSVAGTTDSDTDLLAGPPEGTKVALEVSKVKGRDGGSGADEGNSSRDNGSETHDWT